MGTITEISWTNSTWNPWQGCRKISEGCRNCYMFRDKKRFNQDPEKIHRSANSTFNAPLRWKNPAKVFVCSWSDFFIEDADPWRDESWEIMRKTPHLTYQVLTKRPNNIAVRLPNGWPLPNVWIGVTAENQNMFEERMIYLSEIDALVKFVSVEPMLGDISIYNYRTDIDWIICGGESGPHSRIMEFGWALSLKNQCDEDGISFFMKQMSGKTKEEREDIPESLMVRKMP